MKLSEFFSSMAQMWPRSPDEHGLKGYARALKRWNLSGKQLQELYEKLIDTYQFYPTVAEMNDTIGGMRRGSKDPVHWVRFDYRGNRFFVRCQDPSNPPLPPEDATGLELYVDRPYGYEPCSAAEGKEAFIAGYKEAGGKMDLIAALMPKPVAVAAPAEPEFVATDDDLPF